MRVVHKARIVPDTAPDAMTEKVIRVRDLGVPVEVALGRWEAADPYDLENLLDRVDTELKIRLAVGSDV